MNTMDFRTAVSRTARMLMALGFAATGLASLAGAASARDETYVSETYGYRVEWDARVWEGQPVDPDGVAFSLAGRGGQAYVEGEGGNAADPNACVTTMADDFLYNNPAAQDFRVARKSIDRPTNDHETGSAELYTFVAPTDAGGFDMIVYFECRPLETPDAVLKTTLYAMYNDYDEDVTAWEDLLAGVFLPGEERAESDATATVSDMTDYENAIVGFSVSWPAETFQVTERASETDGYGVELESETTTSFVIGFPFELAAEDCLRVLAQEFSGRYGELTPARDDMDRPEAGRDSESELFTFAGEDGSTSMVAYIECREINDGTAILAVYFFSEEAAYETESKVWREVLESIKTV